MSDDKDRRTGWLRELKVGSKVFVQSADWRQLRSIATVEKITPTGRMFVGDTVFGPDGHELRGGYARAFLYEWTQEAGDDWRIKQAERRNLAHVRAIDWRKVSPEVIRQVLDLVEKAGS